MRINTLLQTILGSSIILDFLNLGLQLAFFWWYFNLCAATFYASSNRRGCDYVRCTWGRWQRCWSSQLAPFVTFEVSVNPCTEDVISQGCKKGAICPIISIYCWNQCILYMSNGHSFWTAPASKSPPDSRVIFPRLTLSIVNASSNFDRPTNFWSKKCEIVRCCAIVGKGHRASKTYLLVLRKSRTSSVSLVETYSYPAVICLCQSHNHSTLVWKLS